MFRCLIHIFLASSNRSCPSRSRRCRCRGRRRLLDNYFLDHLPQLIFVTVLKHCLQEDFKIRLKRCQIKPRTFKNGPLAEQPCFLDRFVINFGGQWRRLLRFFIFLEPSEIHPKIRSRKNGPRSISVRRPVPDEV